MKNKKAQSSIEFTILAGFILLFIISFAYVLNENMSDDVRQRRDLMVNNILISAQDEISLASKSRDGYFREFQLPNKIDNIDYNISIIGGSVYVIMEDGKNSGILPVASVMGQPVRGDNLIKKQNGIIYLNP
jgi:hypothetical protein